ncbi:uncharacterized protein CLUP02_16436 [Colletotrichum lupini]|uniref:Uncharacterized protein n=1 Tax=Colletotrichum lupini TaxID=145971 RepID=A0A9Q8T7X3_9PEZI|nr:uncharacterized protein CLUP02_16436 [Colletotrichum lupini]UQC90904.1 hypothetical protein CLUP02_16436 [Colletotrichum lupini]
MDRDKAAPISPPKCLVLYLSVPPSTPSLPFPHAIPSNDDPVINYPSKFPSGHQAVTITKVTTTKVCESESPPYLFSIVHLSSFHAECNENGPGGLFSLAPSSTLPCYHSNPRWPLRSADAPVLHRTLVSSLSDRSLGHFLIVHPTSISLTTLSYLLRPLVYLTIDRRIDARLVVRFLASRKVIHSSVIGWSLAWLCSTTDPTLTPPALSLSLLLVLHLQLPLCTSFRVGEGKAGTRLQKKTALRRHVLAHALVSILIPILHQTKVWTILSRCLFRPLGPSVGPLRPTPAGQSDTAAPPLPIHPPASSLHRPETRPPAVRNFDPSWLEPHPILTVLLSHGRSCVKRRSVLEPRDKNEDPRSRTSWLISSLPPSSLESPPISIHQNPIHPTHPIPSLDYFPVPGPNSGPASAPHPPKKVQPPLQFHHQKRAQIVPPWPLLSCGARYLIFAFPQRNLKPRPHRAPSDFLHPTPDLDEEPLKLNTYLEKYLFSSLWNLERLPFTEYPVPNSRCRLILYPSHARDTTRLTTRTDTYQPLASLEAFWAPFISRQTSQSLPAVVRLLVYLIIFARCRLPGFQQARLISTGLGAPNSSRSNYRSPANLIWRILHWCYAHNSQISRQLDHRYSYSSAVDLEWRPRPRTSTRIKPTSDIASLASHPIPSAARRGAPLNQLPSRGVCASLSRLLPWPLTKPIVLSPQGPRDPDLTNRVRPPVCFPCFGPALPVYT